MKMPKWLFLTLTVMVVTLACSSTSLLPSKNTPFPISTPIPGWKQFTGSGAEIWLPENFQGGDVNKDLDVIVQNLRSLGPDFEQMAKMIEQNPSMFAVLAYESKVDEGGMLPNMNITKEKVISSMTIENYLDIAIPKFPSQMQVMERKMVTLDHYEAGRLFIDFNLPDQGVAKELMYVIKVDNVMWVIVYTCSEKGFARYWPIFNTSINTFAVN